MSGEARQNMSFDFKQRLTWLQEKMKQAGLDLVVYGSCQNFQYQTGLLIDWRHNTDLGSATNNVFVPRTGEPILTVDEEWAKEASESWIKDIRVFTRKNDGYEKQLEKILKDLCLTGKTVGLGDHVWGSTVTAIEDALKHPTLQKAEHLLDDARMIKDSGEVDKLRKVAKLTDETVEAIVPKIKKGVTQRQLRIELEYEGRKRGASDVSFPPWIGFVKSGTKAGANLVTCPLDEGLRSGTSIAFDNGFVLDGYCSDFGRSFYIGPASTEVKGGYEALQQSVVETVDKMHEGSMGVYDVFPAIEKTLDKRGYGDYLRARLPMKSVGHSIGVEVHEQPWLEPGYNEVLKSQMVMAIEPKLWHSGEYYLRVEDIVLVGKRKTEFLTNFDRKLFQL
jgi:Xaa-Pro aminopeptidase